MSCGHVRKKKKMLCLSVNKKGIISAYALMLLQLFLIFLLLLTQIAITFASVHTQQKQDLLDIAILHSLRVQMDSQKEIEDEEVIEMKEDEEENTEWELIYEGIVVHFQMQKEEIIISYVFEGRNIRCRALLDETKSHLMNYEYL